MQTTAELCCLFRLQQRCQKLQRTAECTDCKIFLSTVVHIDLLTLFKRDQRILFYLGNRTAAVHPDTALKMQVHAPVIHVDRSDRRNFIITDKALGMDKARRILVNLNAGFQQDLVIGLRQNIDNLLIRDARRYNPHIDSALCRHAESGQRLVVRNQIRGKNIKIFFRL